MSGTDIASTGASIGLRGLLEMRIGRNLSIPALYVLGLTVATGAFGEDTSTQQQARPILEEVIVTAQKSESLLSKTPIAMTNVDGVMLERNGMDNISDVQHLVPNLKIGEFYNKAKITIRGIGNENLVLGGDTGVAYHVDNVYIARPEEILASFFDVDRIEVLRGPQGTLYGRNATGGTINVINNKPTESFEANGYLESGNFDRMGVGGVISGPLTGHGLLGRLSFRKLERDGYVRNTVPGGHDTYSQDFYSLRGMLSFQPSDTLNIDVSASYHEDDDDGISLKSMGTLFGPSIPELFYGGAVSQDDFVVPSNQDSYHTTELKNASITANWDFDNLTLTSVTGYHDTETETLADSDGTDFDYQVVRYTDTGEQFSQEFRLSSLDNEHFDWLVGAYYFSDESTQVLFTDIEGLLLSVDPLILVPFAVHLGGSMDTEAYALFGNVKMKYSDRLHFEAGLRYSNDEKKMNEFNDFPFLSTASASKSWDELTYKLGIQFFPTEKSNLYATVSSGFKSGGFNVGSLAPAYDPETALSFEVGFKTRFLEDRAELSVGAFYTDYEDLQVGKVSEVIVIIENAAEAVLQGVELEGTMLFNEHFRLSAAFAYLDATFNEFVNVDVANLAAGEQDLSGNNLPNSPELTFSLTPEYSVSLANWGVLTVFASYYWQDRVYFEAFNNKPYSQSSVGRIDVGITYESNGGKWRLNAYGRNLGDEEVVNNVVVGSALIGGPGLANLAPPRSFGVRLEYNL